MNLADNLFEMSCMVCQLDCRLGAMSTFFGLGKDARAIDDGKAQGTDTDAAEQSEQSDEGQGSRFYGLDVLREPLMRHHMIYMYFFLEHLAPQLDSGSSSSFL